MFGGRAPSGPAGGSTLPDPLAAMRGLLLKRGGRVERKGKVGKESRRGDGDGRGGEGSEERGWEGSLRLKRAAMQLSNAGTVPGLGRES